MTAYLDRAHARMILASRLPQDPKWVAWIEGTLDELGLPETTTPEQTEFWEVEGGIGGTRVACDLPSREAAEVVAREFAERMRRLPVPQTMTRVVRQHGRYRS